jgi:hypothetical protein
LPADEIEGAFHASNLNTFLVGSIYFSKSGRWHIQPDAGTGKDDGCVDL